MELYPHQQKAVDELDWGKILHGGVGTGKTATSLAFYAKNGNKKPLYVITTAKKRDDLDWMREGSAFGIGTEEGATTHGVMTIDSWQNVAKYDSVKDAVFIFDEQRLTGRGAWVRAFLKIAKSNQWILLTATPGDNWMDYGPVFVANGFFKNITHFFTEHVRFEPYVRYPKLKEYLNTDHLQRLREQLLVPMPYLSHTNRKVQWLTTSVDEETVKRVHKDRWNVFEEQPVVDAGEMFRLLRRVASTDKSRREAMLKILEKHPKAIVFYNFNYERDILLELDADIEIGEWNGHKKTPVPTGDRWLYLVQYSSGAEGWNCITTDCIVFWSPTYSWKQFEQSQGRIDRLDTPYTDLWYYVFTADTIAERAIRKALDRKEEFNETAYVKRMQQILMPDTLDEKWS